MVVWLTAIDMGQLELHVFCDELQYAYREVV